MKLLLVDGTNVVMRCAAVQTNVPPDDVIASAGRMIRRAAEDPIAATHLVVAFDAFGPSFRHARYPEYKAHRAARAAETSQWAMAACTAFESSGLYCVVAEGFEADDILATVAARAVPNLVGDSSVHILSGDSDLLALASASVHCWQFGRRDRDEPAIVERSVPWICEKYGIQAPSFLTDYKALVGEPGDNVRGVRGVGHKKARALLTEFGSLDGMQQYGMLGTGAGSHALAMRELITLRTDVPLAAIKPSACRFGRRSSAA